MRHKWHLVLGLVWGAAILALAPQFIWWLMPVLVGMVLAVPFTVLTSRTSLGRALRAKRSAAYARGNLAAAGAHGTRGQPGPRRGDRSKRSTGSQGNRAGAATTLAPQPAPRGVAAASAAPMSNGHAVPTLELFVRVPQHAPLAMPSSEAATLALASRAA